MLREVAEPGVSVGLFSNSHPSLGPGPGGSSGQYLIQALGLCRHPWPWAVYKVSVYRGYLSLRSLILSLCPEWYSAQVTSQPLSRWLQTRV